jgi:uncharacterized membrane protein
MPIEHIHPMIVHFPIVLVIMAALFDLWALTLARPVGDTPIARNLATAMTAGAGITAVAAYFFGDMALDVAMSRGFTDAQLESHEGWGTTTAIALAAIALVRLVMWRRRLDRKRGGAMLATAMSLAAVFLVAVTAYFGGHLVYDLGVNIKPAA